MEIQLRDASKGSLQFAKTSGPIYILILEPCGSPEQIFRQKSLSQSYASHLVFTI